ncbi:unnamed protein product, partial [Hapterophycus canaliculatus]
MGFLALVSFSLPGREGPGSAGGLDLIALAKLAIRLAVLVWFGAIFVLIRRYIVHGEWTTRILLPWWCFLAWSLITIGWSALKVVSIGQWLGLAALIAMTQVIA